MFNLTDFFYNKNVYLVRFFQPSSILEKGSSHPFEELEAQFPSTLLEELFGITILIGRLKDLPPNVQSAFTIQNQGKVLLINSSDLWLGFIRQNSHGVDNYICIWMYSICICFSCRFSLPLGICYTSTLIFIGLYWRYFICLVSNYKVCSLFYR